MTQQHFSDRPHTLCDLVYSTLCRNPYLTGRNVRIQVVDDSVVLSGVVNSYYQKQMAQESLRQVQGLGQVRNEIQVVTV